MFVSAHEMVKAARERIDSQSRQAFRAEHSRRYKLYHGDVESLVMERVKKLLPNTYVEVQPIWLDVYPNTVNELAGRLYAQEPTRVVANEAGNSAPASVTAKVLAQLERWKFSSVMDKVACYLESHRTLAVSLKWRGDSLAFDVLPPNVWDVIPGKPDGTSLSDVECFIELMPDRTAVIWNGTHEGAPPIWVHIDHNGEEIKRGENPYGILPFVVLRYQEPDTEFFLKGNESLEQAALHTAFELTDMAYVGRMQSFGVPVFKGFAKGDESKMVLSPTRGVSLDKEQDFDFKAPPKSDSRFRDLKEFLALFAASKHLPPDTYIPSTLPESGIARRVTQSALNKHRSDYAALMSELEECLYKSAVKVHNWHVKPTSDSALPYEYELKTRLAPAEVFIDPLEKNAQDATRVATGQDSYPAILARELRISVEAATEIVRANLALTRSLEAHKPVAVSSAAYDSTTAATAEIQAANSGSEAGKVAAGLAVDRANRGRVEQIPNANS